MTMNIDPESRRRTNKTIAIVFGVLFLAMCIAFGAFIYFKGQYDKQHAVELREKFIADSTESAMNFLAREAAGRRHDSLMTHSRHYRDSVNGHHRDSIAADRKLRTDSADQFLSVSIDHATNFRQGRGVEVTLSNESARVFSKVVIEYSGAYFIMGKESEGATEFGDTITIAKIKPDERVAEKYYVNPGRRWLKPHEIHARILSVNGKAWDQ